MRLASSSSSLRGILTRYRVTCRCGEAAAGIRPRTARGQGRGSSKRGWGQGRRWAGRRSELARSDLRSSLSGARATQPVGRLRRSQEGMVRVFGFIQKVCGLFVKSKATEQKRVQAARRLAPRLGREPGPRGHCTEPGSVWWWWWCRAAGGGGGGAEGGDALPRRANSPGA